MIVYLTTDLMMASSANSFARQHNIKMTQVANQTAALEAIDQERPHLFLIDLQTPGLDIPDLSKRLKKLADSIQPLIVSYAQHVQVDQLQQAREAGFDQVLTRGQMNQQMGQFIAAAI